MVLTLGLGAQSGGMTNYTPEAARRPGTPCRPARGRRHPSFPVSFRRPGLGRAGRRPRLGGSGEGHGRVRQTGHIRGRLASCGCVQASPAVRNCLRGRASLRGEWKRLPSDPRDFLKSPPRPSGSPSTNQGVLGLPAPLARFRPLRGVPPSTRVCSAQPDAVSPGSLSCPFPDGCGFSLLRTPAA